jgi:hypothetical protein
MIIAVDAGKHTTKAMSNERQFSMRTLMTENGSILNSDALHVEINGNKYTLGDGESDFDVSKTKLVHKLCTYVSIARLMQVREIDLVTGCPITQFVNKEARQAHADYLRGAVQMTINGERYSFMINSVMVLPETIGAVIANAAEYADKAVGIIDVGGLNCSGAIYSNLKPVKSSVFVMNEGGLMLDAKIKRALNTQFLTNYQDYEIPYIKAEGKFKSVIDGVVQDQLSKIMSECKKYNWNDCFYWRRLTQVPCQAQ